MSLLDRINARYCVANLGGGGGGPTDGRKIGDTDAEFANGLPTPAELPHGKESDASDGEPPWSHGPGGPPPDGLVESPIFDDLGFPFGGRPVHKMPEVKLDPPPGFDGFQQGFERRLDRKDQPLLGFLATLGQATQPKAVTKPPRITPKGPAPRVTPTEPAAQKPAPKPAPKPEPKPVQKAPAPKAPPKVPESKIKPAGQLDPTVQPKGKINQAPVKPAGWRDILAKVKSAYPDIKLKFEVPPTYVWNDKEGTEIDITGIKDKLKARLPQLQWFKDYDGVDVAEIEFPDGNYAELAIGLQANFLTLTQYRRGAGD